MLHPSNVAVRVPAADAAPAQAKTVVRAVPDRLSAKMQAALLNNGVTAAQARATINIQRAFNAYCLPYAGEAATLVQDAAHHHVDPAIVAGFFLHEDGNVCGSPNRLLLADHNPGNIGCVEPGWGCTDGFQNYPSWEAGVDGWFILRDNYVYSSGLRDWQSFVAKYCPSGVDGNGPAAAYEAAVMDFARRIRAGW